MATHIREQVRRAAGASAGPARRARTRRRRARSTVAPLIDEAHQLPEHGAAFRGQGSKHRPVEHLQRAAACPSTLDRLQRETWREARRSRRTRRLSAVVSDLIDRHWKWSSCSSGSASAPGSSSTKWAEIRFFALGDTDDNMRIMQVRALLDGQDWYDLRQYRLNPPAGANIHWSRLVDLPLAGLILLLRPLVGGAGAERSAVAIAPLLPYLLLLFSVGADGAAADRSGAPIRWRSSPCSSPARPTACSCRRGSTIMAGSWRCSRWRSPAIADPKRTRGGADARDRDGAVAGDRARDADLSRARRRGDGAVLGRRPRRDASGCAAYAVTLAAGPRSASWSSPPTPIGTRCATPCRRCGCRTRCSAAPCCSASPACRRRTGSAAWRWPPAPASSSPPSTR